MFVAFGLIGFVEASGYDMGSSLNMGPGYFPVVLSVILTAIGMVILLRAMRIEGDKVEAFNWRGIGLLSVAFICFGLFMEEFNLGFATAAGAVVVLSCIAKKDTRPKEAVIMTVVLVAVAVGTFIYGLGLPYPVFWWY